MVSQILESKLASCFSSQNNPALCSSTLFHVAAKPIRNFDQKDAECDARQPVSEISTTFLANIWHPARSWSSQLERVLEGADLFSFWSFLYDTKIYNANRAPLQNRRRNSKGISRNLAFRGYFKVLSNEHCEANVQWKCCRGRCKQDQLHSID